MQMFLLIITKPILRQSSAVATEQPQLYFFLYMRHKQQTPKYLYKLCLSWSFAWTWQNSYFKTMDKIYIDVFLKTFNVIVDIFRKLLGNIQIAIKSPEKA